ncbi:hypothetical protein [Pseudonocardia spirodelae]|uniref:Uncharacterized protein n=1 Tax=Pseudonocardia spirodelae TaxID=3133431 RepID=A0ABU8TCF2_9PSEU
MIGPRAAGAPRPAGGSHARPWRATPVLALAAAALLVVQQVPGLLRMRGTAVPLLPVGLWRGWIPLMLAGLLLLAASALLGLRRPGRTSTAGRAAGLLLALGPATVLAYQGRLVDPLSVYLLGADPGPATWPVLDVVLGTGLAAVLAAALWVVLPVSPGAAGRPTARARGRAPR